jgi:hypothetical protein
MTTNERATFLEAAAANPDWLGLSLELVLAQMARSEMHPDLLRDLRSAHAGLVTEAGLLEAAVFASMYSYPEAFLEPFADSSATWAIIWDMVKRARFVGHTLLV